MSRANKLVSKIAKKRRTLTSQFEGDRSLRRSQATLESLHDTVSKYNQSETLPEKLKHLEKKTRPTKGYVRYINFMTRVRFKLSRLSKRTKIQKIKKLFGNNGENLGLLLIKPEMFGESNKIKKMLLDFGFNIVDIKNLVFDKQKIHQIYGDEFGKGYDFQIQAINLMNAPSKIIIFKQMPRNELYLKSTYLTNLRRDNPKEYVQMIKRLDQMSIPEVFSELYKGSFFSPKKGSIRHEFVYPQFERFKQARAGYLDSLLDVFGYFKTKKSKTEPAYKFSGIHTISSVDELHRVIDSVFTRREINNLEKRLLHKS